jgi:dUTP pyrophosphatase
MLGPFLAWNLGVATTLSNRHATLTLSEHNGNITSLKRPNRSLFDIATPSNLKTPFDMLFLSSLVTREPCEVSEAKDGILAVLRKAPHPRPNGFANPGTTVRDMPMPPITIPLRRLPHGTDLPIPAYATDGAAGMDVVAAEALILAPGARHAVATGFAMAVPEGYEVQVRPRSGLALKHGITCLNTPGTIDSDYRGEVKVILANLGSEPFEIKRGDRIAQLVPAPVQRATLLEVSTLDDTSRGSGGFGSTGV